MPINKLPVKLEYQREVIKDSYNSSLSPNSLQLSIGGIELVVHRGIHVVLVVLLVRKPSNPIFSL